jgi:hypothetical protein
LYGITIVVLPRSDSQRFVATLMLNPLKPGIVAASFFWLAAAATAEPDISGIWVLEGRATERELLLTEEARRIQADYDLLNDDPSLQCEPASLSRVWANPNSRFKIEQSQGQVLISFELFDLRRAIPIGDATAITDTPSTKNLDGLYFSKMGSSFAWYEDDRLLIETRRHSPGYIRTSSGIPQSGNTVAFEEIWLEGDTLKMTLTYEDNALFEIPFIIDHIFERIEGSEILPYNCEGADYDWFEILNAPEPGSEPGSEPSSRMNRQ